MAEARNTRDIELVKRSISNEEYNSASPAENELKKETVNKKQKRPWQELNCCQKLCRIITNITVEPILACFVMPSVLCSLATQNLFLDKACRVNFGFDEDVCDALMDRNTANYTSEEEAVQKLVASVAGWKTVVQSFLPCCLLLFVGAYSDRVRQRKFCMLIPIVGEFLASIGLILNTYYFYELPVEVAAVTQAIFPALTGGWFVMFMGVFCYITDITTEDERTLRIGIVNLFFALGMPVGSALSGILLREIGLYGVFTVTAVIYTAAFIYTIFRINEKKRIDPNAVQTNGCCDWVRDFFNIKYVKETLSIAFKKGPNNRRLKVSLLFVVLCVVIGPTYGELSVVYLFTRYRFNWDEIDYSIFSTFSVCTSLLGTIIAVGGLSHVLKFDDAFIGIIACMSKILAAIVFAFAVYVWQIYLAPVIEMFSGVAFIAKRAIVSKIVPNNELGKVNAFFGMGEAMMPLIYAPMYTQVYTASINTLPGAFYLLGGGLTIPAALIFLWLYISGKKLRSRNNNESSTETGLPEKKPIEDTTFETVGTRPENVA